MLEIRNITKVYRSKTGEEVKALDNVSIQFPESGMVFILGKSGSGKSTLLNVIGGLDSYDSGEFVIKGKSSKDFAGSDFDAYRNTFIGFIFQEYNVLDDFSVGANIALALELQGKKATDEAVNGILSQVDLLNFAKRKPNELSGGQKQRVAIARALVKEPEIIMADEPTGALDSNTGKQIFDTLKELSKTKLVLIVSHDRDFAERYADRIVELADGKIIEDVTKHEHRAEQISEGVHRINDNILRIERGYKLTAKDLEMINAYLAKTQGDVLLSGDGRVNEELRSAAGISKDGGTTVFEGTDPAKDVPVKAYEKGKTKFIRSRLPMKNAVKMGSSGLKHKKFRLFMTVLLSFISFAMFGLSSSLAAYNKIEAATQSIVDSEIRSAALTLGVRRTTTWDDGDSYTSHDGEGFNDEDIARLKEQTGLSFVPVFTGQSYSDRWNRESSGFELSHMMSNYSSNTVYNGRLSGLVSIGRDQLPTEYNLAGRFPEAKGEIVITEFMYRQFNQYGFTDGTNTIAAGKLTMNNDGSQNDIIGKTIIIDRIGWQSLGESNAFKFKIVGIIDTSFNYDRYASLMPVDPTQSQHQQQAGVQTETTLLDMFLQEEISYERDFGFHALGFAMQEDIDNMTPYMENRYYGDNGGNDFDVYMYAGDQQLRFYVYQKPEVEGDTPVRLTGFGHVSSSSALSKLGENVYWLSGTPKTALAENELLISIERLQEFLPTKENKADTAALGLAFLAAFPECETTFNDMMAGEHPDVVQAMIVSYQSAHSDIGYEEAKMAILANRSVQSALMTTFGLECPANMSARGATYILSLFYNSEIDYNSLEYAFRQMYVANVVAESGYHLVENMESDFVKRYLNRNKEDPIQPSYWKDQLNDDQRFQELVSGLCWEVGNGTSWFEITDVERCIALLNIYLAATDTDATTFVASLENLQYSLEITIWGKDGEENSPYKDWSDLKIVGFYYDDINSDMVISERIYNEYDAWRATQEEILNEDAYVPNYKEERAKHEAGIWAFVVAPISANDTDAIEKLVTLSYANPDTTDYLFEMQNAVMYTLGNFNEMIEILAQVFVWVGLGLAVFSSFLLMNFISTSISYKKREIGILRAVGARSSDVFKIFFSEAFIIALINFVLATAASLTTVILLNNYMRNSGINITLLNFGVLQAAMMLGISVAVAFLASFMPVYKIAHKKPVDAIKDR